MKKGLFNIFLYIVLSLPTCESLVGQIRSLDEFENKDGWSAIMADGVNLSISNDKGQKGNAIRLDYEYIKGTGYGGIQKFFPIDLPENFEISFDLKAESPANNFEIKFIDSTGNNVWWVNNRNYDFPKEWKRIHVRRRHINFAWGPTADQSFKRIDRIEFTIASFVGGKGTIWIDNLKFEALPPETQSYPTPSATATSSMPRHPVEMIFDNSEESYWQSNKPGETLEFDLKTLREFGGLQIDWLKDFSAQKFNVFTSEDGKTWNTVYSVESNKSNVSFISLPESEAKKIRLELLKSNSDKGYGICNIEFLAIKNSLTKNDFIIYASKNSRKGNYPRYFSEQASYWTINGVNNDVKEALINEDGMVEVDKALFSIEPMLRFSDSLYNWSNVKSTQFLGFSGEKKDFNFAPTVRWYCKDLKFETSITASGQANKNSRLNIQYSFENESAAPLNFELYLLVRPYQVDPYYQALNLTGGVGKIFSIEEENNGNLIIDDKVIIPENKYYSFGASAFNDGSIVDLLREGLIPQNKSAFDKYGLANGVIKYLVHLGPYAQTKFSLVVPFYGRNSVDQNWSVSNISDESRKSIDFWRVKTGHVKFNLPESANPLVNTYRSNLAYILINRDNAGIQPGSRSYERSWIRDGALTSSALLKSGIVSEVKDFINWYTAHQYENGKVPCVVDSRGPDPVPENDSHGEMIYLIREYFNFTHDTAFLRSKNPNVVKAVEYIEYLMAQNSADHFINGNDSVRACYGLVTESISHEGYSAKPMHSYWDDFFIMKGLKDAVEIQKILGENISYDRIKKVRDTFRENLYNSIRLAMKNKKIDYIPGCAELGDFDATSTTIALTPCNELRNLPKPEVYNTFNKYYEFFKNRRDDKLVWDKYTPYEVRLIGSFIMLDEPDRAHELIDFFLKDQRPQGWNHWAEVVWKDYRFPGYIGDMPHTWIGSDFVNAFRTMFVYENEYDQSLVLGAALYKDWIDSPGGMSVENLPTYYGEVSYLIKKENERYIFSITGDLKLPVDGIKIKNFNNSRLPLRVSINGIDSKDFTNKEISIRKVPAEVIIYY